MVGSRWCWTGAPAAVGWSPRCWTDSADRRCCSGQAASPPSGCPECRGWNSCRWVEWWVEWLRARACGVRGCVAACVRVRVRVRACACGCACARARVRACAPKSTCSSYGGVMCIERQRLGDLRLDGAPSKNADGAAAAAHVPTQRVIVGARRRWEVASDMADHPRPARVPSQCVQPVSGGGFGG